MVVRCHICNKTFSLDEAVAQNCPKEILCSTCHRVKQSTSSGTEIHGLCAKGASEPNPEVSLRDRQCSTAASYHNGSSNLSAQVIASDALDKPAAVDKEPSNFELKTTSKGFQIQQVGVSERIKLARTGNKEIRRILIRDPTRTVQVAVLTNQRITQEEVEQIASSKKTEDELLRIIISNREWVKNYAIKLALVKNPKTPLRISLGFLPYLRDKDLKFLANNKNIPNVVAVASNRLYLKRRGQIRVK